MPSKLPIKTVMPTNFVIPDRISAELKFPKANLTLFRKAEKLQEIQAKIACALRLPLEKVEIRNITLLRETGILETLDIDVTVARLTSNGFILCMVFKDSPIVPQVGRRMLQGSTDSIVVNYDIVSPPVEIASASTNDLNAAITGDASIAAFAKSVGSTGVVGSGSSDSGGGDTVVAPDNSMTAVGIGVGVAVGAAGIIGMGIAAYMYQDRKRHHVRQAIRPVPTAAGWHPSVVTVNPSRMPGYARV